MRKNKTRKTHTLFALFYKCLQTIDISETHVQKKKTTHPNETKSRA